MYDYVKKTKMLKNFRRPVSRDASPLKDVVTPYTHISEASRYILYTIILTFDGICTLS